MKGKEKEKEIKKYGVGNKIKDRGKQKQVRKTNKKL